MPLSIYDLIPNGIAFYKSEADFALKAPGTPAPRNPNTPTKLWRDNAPIWNFWGSVMGQNLEYKFFARTPLGSIALTPIDRNNPKFTGTYNLTVVNTLVEHAFMFPNGVPYLETISIPSSYAAELNIQGNPALPPVDFPVKEGSFVFIPTSDGKSVTAYDYQEFLQMAKPPKMSDEERIAVVKKIVDAPMTAAAKVGAIRKALTDFGGDFVLT